MLERSIGDPKRDCGFTLIELLVVLAVFSLVLVVLTGGVSFASRAWKTQERLIDRQGDFGSLAKALRRIIASGRDFKGDAGSLAFIGALPRALGQPGQYDIELKTSDDRLVLAWRRHAFGAASTEPMTETELAGSVAGLDLAYYDAGVAQWSDHSADPPNAPALIRLSVHMIESRRRSWPPLVVAPMIEPSTAQK
jgi:prepilin-type N-terminal cleavage/methylation domain-containing protein